MRQVTVSELSGYSLDYAVAQCLIKRGLITDDAQVGDMPNEKGAPPYFNLTWGKPCLWGAGKIHPHTHNKDTGKPWVFHGSGGDYSPSTKWRDGGYVIDIMSDEDVFTVGTFSDTSFLCHWFIDDVMHSVQGETPLIATMRCFVFAELGEIVEIPDEVQE